MSDSSSWVTLHLYPIIYAILVWWLSTGILIWLAGLPQRTIPWTFSAMTAFMLFAVWQLYVHRNDTSVWGAYGAFTWATLAWGWHELGYYSGFITGIKGPPCPEGCGGWPHFWHAVKANIYHELAVLATVLLVWAIHWDAANTVGLWTFLILWWMHQSAKLNVFFGVRNLNEEFLPDRLRYMSRFFTKRSMNGFFPLSVTVSTIITAWLFEGAISAPTDAGRVGLTFLALFMALAILEHWLLVLPFNPALWRWGLRSRGKLRPADIEVVAGFLGAGKTTFVRRLLDGADPDVKTVVLVNDFGEVGIDGALLQGRGADVVELANGCICCSLQGDLAMQLLNVVSRFQPQRVVIEPSGVAEVASLLQTLARPNVVGAVRSVKVYTLVDARSFLNAYAELPGYFEAQAHLAPLIIVNKSDLVTDGELRTVQQTLRSLNPGARQVVTSYGIVEAEVLAALQPSVLSHEEHDHDEHEHEHQVALGLEAYSLRVPAGPFDENALRGLLAELAAGVYGRVVRSKGIITVRRGWVQFDLAAGEASMIAYAHTADSDQRATVIGSNLDRAAIEAAFAACAVGSAPVESRTFAPAT